MYPISFFQIPPRSPTPPLKSILKVRKHVSWAEPLEEVRVFERMEWEKALNKKVDEKKEQEEEMMDVVEDGKQEEVATERQAPFCGRADCRSAWERRERYNRVREAEAGEMMEAEEGIEENMEEEEGEEEEKEEMEVEEFEVKAEMDEEEMEEAEEKEGEDEEMEEEEEEEEEEAEEMPVWIAERRSAQLAMVKIRAIAKVENFGF